MTTPSKIYPKTKDYAGDRITFEYRGRRYTGIALSASNWGDDPDNPNWFIEWKNEETGQMGYWKQIPDGGNGKLIAVEHYCPEHDEYFASSMGECEGCLWDSEADLRAAEGGQLLEEDNDRWASDDDPRSF
ncbi:MAG: hypothetical protein ACYTE3_12895 [Planctomycetota bacterium]|jgi:hypothetical protein